MLKSKHQTKDAYSIVYFVLTIITLVYALFNIDKILNWGQFEWAIQLFLLAITLLAFGLTFSNKKKLAKRKKTIIYNIANAILFAPLPIYVTLTFIPLIPTSNEINALISIACMLAIVCALHYANLKINKRIPHLYPILSAVIFTIAAVTSLLSNINTEDGTLNWLPFLLILIFLAILPLGAHFLYLRKNNK